MEQSLSFQAKREGEHTYRQLTELYRALHLYVNCFQPSMKLLSKQRHGKKVRCMYDPAKTPLQRLLLSGVLAAQKQQELTEVVQALDPILLFQQVEQLQQALFRCAIDCSPFVPCPPSASLRSFSVEHYTAGTLSVVRSVPYPASGLRTLYREQERRKRILGWRRTHKDPFDGEWEQIMFWLVANPERSSGDIFRELQRLSPGRYHPLQIRTLQRGMRKIRVHLLETFEEQWQDEVIRGPVPRQFRQRNHLIQRIFSELQPKIQRSMAPFFIKGVLIRDVSNCIRCSFFIGGDADITGRDRPSFHAISRRHATSR